ncbi:MAG: hypothetical protein GY851_29770 [bacterium]|nr:hypothetical protein [bacterium]
MNPNHQRQLEDIEELIERLGGHLDSLREDATQTAKERETLQTEAWRQQKELSILSDLSENAESTETENERLRGALKGLRERLTAVLGQAKALGEELRS